MFEGYSKKHASIFDFPIWISSYNIAQHYIITNPTDADLKYITHITT